MPRPSKKIQVSSGGNDAAQLAAELAGACDRARGGWQVDDSIRVVPCYFPGLDRAVVSGTAGLAGGWPLGSTAIVHGAEAAGKTSFLAGLSRSFQRAGGVVYYLDAELVLDLGWVWRLGVESERFVMLGRARQAAKEKPIEPLYYEQAILHVDDVIERFVMAVHKGRKVGPMLLVVDSLTKLVPKASAKRLAKKGDARSASIGRDQAGFNTTWVKDLGPKVADHDIAVVFVVHDMEGEMDMRGRPTRRMKGGKGILYDASLILDLQFAGRSFDLADSRLDGSEKESRPVVAKKHRVRVEKTKIGPQVFGPSTSFEFFVGTGAGVAPRGFDRPREILNEAARRGRVGIEWTWDFNPTLGSRFELDGKSHTLKQLYEDSELVSALESLLR